MILHTSKFRHVFSGLLGSFCRADFVFSVLLGWIAARIAVHMAFFGVISGVDWFSVVARLLSVANGDTVVDMMMNED